MRHDWTRRLLIGICAIALSAALGRAADEPASEPEAGPPATATLAGGVVEYAPPPEGWTAKESDKDNARIHISPSRESAVAIEVWPPDGQLGGGIGAAMVKKLRETRRQSGVKVIKQPTLEKDKRFAIRIHEQYEREVKGKDGPEQRVVDQLHLYRKAGPRVVMVTVNSVVKEQGQAGEINRIGEEVALSAKYVPPPKAEKAPKRGRN